MANFVLFFTVNIFRLVISLKKIGDIVTPMVIINIYHISSLQQHLCYYYINILCYADIYFCEIIYLEIFSGTNYKLHG